MTALAAVLAAVVVLLRAPGGAERLSRSVRPAPSRGPMSRQRPGSVTVHVAGPARDGDRGAWSRIRRRSASSVARRPAPLPGPLLLDLVAALLRAGAAPDAALRAVGAVLAADGDPRGPRLLARSVDLARTPAETDPELEPLVEALRLAVVSGLPPAGLVRTAAEEERRRAAAGRRRAMRRLEVLLVLPVGLCLLPAFVLLGVAPLVLNLLGR